MTSLVILIGYLSRGDIDRPFGHGHLPIYSVAYRSEENGIGSWGKKKEFESAMFPFVFCFA